MTGFEPATSTSRTGLRHSLEIRNFLSQQHFRNPINSFNLINSNGFLRIPCRYRAITLKALTEIRRKSCDEEGKPPVEFWTELRFRSPVRWTISGEGTWDRPADSWIGELPFTHLARRSAHFPGWANCANLFRHREVHHDATIGAGADRYRCNAGRPS